MESKLFQRQTEEAMQWTHFSKQTVETAIGLQYHWVVAPRKIGLCVCDRISRSKEQVFRFQ